jgi:zinc protease
MAMLPYKLLLVSPALLAAATLRAPVPAGSELKTTLKNGMEVVIVPDRLAPVVTTVMNYRVGSDEAPAGFPGMAHAQEHMMFRGSPGLSANQLAGIGAGLGGQFNADTQQSVTQYIFTVPADDLNVALHIEALRMRGVLDTEALWKQERGAIEQEVDRDLSSPEYVFYTQLLQILFKDTPYAHDALGTVPSFNRTTGAMLQKFHETWYAPNNAVLVITGNIQPDVVLAEVKNLFDPIPSRPLPARPVFRFEAVAPEKIHLDTDLPYGLALIAFRMPGSHSPDYAAAQVLAKVISSKRGSLAALAAEGRALQTDFSLGTLPRAGLGYALAAFPAGGDAEKQVEQLRAILTGDLQAGFPQDLVEASRRDVLLQAELRKNSISGLAMDWSEAVAIEGRSSPEADVQAMERITAADVNRVAHQYLDLSHAVVAILTPQTSGKTVAASMPPSTESFASSPVGPVVMPAWAQQAVTRLALPAWDVHPSDTRLANGLRVIVQPEAVSDTVSVFGHIRNDDDLESPPGQDGVSDVVSRLFSYGTQTRDRLAFQKALDDIGATESGGTDFSLQVLGPHFERGVQLLAENEQQPRMQEADFQIVREQVARTLAGELKSPGYLTQRALEAALFPKTDPTLRQATPAKVSALTIEDVKSYYQRAYRPDLTSIVVIGNITPENARAVIEKYFGDWANLGPQPPTILPPVPLNQSSLASVPDRSRIQDEVTIAETLGINRFNADYYALQLGNHILGGGFYATRLYQDLREQTGLVYTVASNLNVRRTRGIYSVKFGCLPANVDRAAAIVRHDLEEMRMQSVSEAVFRQAKVLLLHEIPLSEASETQIARGFLNRSDEGLPLDEPMRAAARYLELNSEQVRAAFQKWIRPEALARVVEGPSPQ